MARPTKIAGGWAALDSIRDSVVAFAGPEAATKIMRQIVEARLQREDSGIGIAPVRSARSTPDVTRKAGRRASTSKEGPRMPRGKPPARAEAFERFLSKHGARHRNDPEYSDADRAHWEKVSAKGTGGTAPAKAAPGRKPARKGKRGRRAKAVAEESTASS